MCLQDVAEIWLENLTGEAKAFPAAYRLVVTISGI
jgi:hypothetical protein